MATACNLSTIPSGIRRQMEFITIPSYSEGQKIKIAKDYIIPELLEYYRIKSNLKISRNALVGIIRDYTREAGVREFQKNLKTICRFVVTKIRQENINKVIKISAKKLASYLGPPGFYSYNELKKNEIGIITTLGKSDRGGCPVTLELLTIKGEGKIIFTGNLDKMLQESAMVAIDYVRSICAKFGIDDDFHKKYDIHLHMLQSSTPKYGVSVGMAIVIVLVSALTGKPVRSDVGMTGEISLHGRVFGVREKEIKLWELIRPEYARYFYQKLINGI